MYIGRIFNEDCIEGMKRLPDKSIDMILCDLPYGTTARNEWDCVIPFTQLWAEYERIIKDNGVIALFGQPPFDKKLACSNLRLFRYEWIWQKTQGTGHLNAKKMPMKAHENILIFYKALPTYNPQMRAGKPYVCKSGRGSLNYREQKSVVTTNSGERYPIDVLTYPQEKGYHPTQKPVPLLEYLIKTYTNEGEIVLDNCIGSGSTAIACINTGRKFIGFEIDEKYCRIAEERIKAVKANV